MHPFRDCIEQKVYKNYTKKTLNKQLSLFFFLFFLPKRLKQLPD